MPKYLVTFRAILKNITFEIKTADYFLGNFGELYTIFNNQQ